MQRRKTVCDVVKHEAEHGAKPMCFISTAAKQKRGWWVQKIMSVTLSPLRSRTRTEGHSAVLCLFLQERLHEVGRFILEKRGNTQKLITQTQQIFKYVKNASAKKRTPEEKIWPCFWSAKTLSSPGKALPIHVQTFFFSLLNGPFVFQSSSPICQDHSEVWHSPPKVPFAP